jgi:hypothetical protein
MKTKYSSTMRKRKQPDETTHDEFLTEVLSVDFSQKYCLWTSRGSIACGLLAEICINTSSRSKTNIRLGAVISNHRISLLLDELFE